MSEGSPIRHLLKRFDMHIVVLVQGMDDARAEDWPNWPNYPIYPVSIYEKSVGEVLKWEHPYEEVARCKAMQRWTGRTDDRGIIPHLLFAGDAPWAGTAKREEIVVACSGPQYWFDKMIAGMVADTIIALAADAYVNDPANKGVDFLPKY